MAQTPESFDDVMDEYYKAHGRNDYKTEDGKGKMEEW